MDAASADSFWPLRLIAKGLDFQVSEPTGVAIRGIKP